MMRSYRYREQHSVHEEWESENEYSSDGSETEESSDSEDECYNYGSGKQMMQSNHHQMMVNGANNMHQVQDVHGWNKQGMAQQGWNTQGMAQQGWNTQGMAQQGWNNQEMVQHGWNNQEMVQQGWNEQDAAHRGRSNQGMAQRGWSKQGSSQHGWNKQSMDQHGWNKQGMIQQGRNDLYKKRSSMNESQICQASMYGGYRKQGSNAYNQMQPSSQSVIVEEKAMYQKHSSWQTSGGGYHFNDNFKNWKINGYN